MSPRLKNPEHYLECWRFHDDCALRTAANFEEARAAHSRSRRDLFRAALRSLSFDSRMSAVDLARDMLHDAHGTNWKSIEART